MQLIGQLLAVSGVLLLLTGSLWWLRRKGLAGMRPPCGGRPRTLEPVERVALTPQHSLHLVRLGSRALVVAVWPAGCTLVESGDWAAITSDPLAGAREVH